MDDNRIFKMPGGFPGDPAGGEEQVIHHHRSPSKQVLAEAVLVEISSKKSLINDIYSSRNIDIEEIEILRAEILSLEDQFQRLIMESQNNSPTYGAGQHPNQANVFRTQMSPFQTPSRGPSTDIPRKRGYSQVESSPKDVKTETFRRRMVDAMAASGHKPVPSSSANHLKGTSSRFPPSHPSFAGPSSLPSSATIGSKDEEIARAMQTQEVYDLTGLDDDDDDDNYQVLNSIYDSFSTPNRGPTTFGLTAPHQHRYLNSIAAGSLVQPRIKYEPRGNKLESWALAKPEPPSQSPYYMHNSSPIVGQHNFMGNGLANHPLVIDDNDLEGVQAGLAAFNSVLNGAHPGAYLHNGQQQFPHYHIPRYYPQPPQIKDEHEEVSKILQHVADHAEDKPPSDRMETPKEMSIKLLEHQKIGYTWLVKQEEGHNKGGILGDDMGLGKTVQAIALIVGRRSDKKHHKTTLIVCPVALMRQWQLEIETKVKKEHELSTHIYHGQQLKRYKDFDYLKRFDVVITSYGTLAGEYKKKKNWKMRELSDASAKEFPFLSSKSTWYRVILDESQYVKNHQTQTSQACADLMATHRLCLSGTPMQNSIDDLFGAVRFLGIPRYREFKDWNRDFGRQIRLGKEYKADAMQRLQAFIRAIMLRRKKDSMIDGKPILNLPQKHLELVHPILSEDELEIYNAVEQRAQIRFNKYLESGTVSRNYTYILLLLLRLRQVCCHPKMIKDLSMKITDEELSRQEALLEELSPEAIERLKQEEITQECPICCESNITMKLTVPCGHFACQECFAKYADRADMGNMANAGNSVMCPYCRGPIDPSRVVDWDSFLKVHRPADYGEYNGALHSLDDILGGQIPSESEDSSDTQSDDDSDDEESLKDFIVDDDDSDLGAEEQDDEDEEILNSPIRKSRTLVKGKNNISQKHHRRLKTEDYDTEDSIDALINGVVNSTSGGKSQIDIKDEEDEEDDDLDLRVTTHNRASLCRTFRLDDSDDEDENTTAALKSEDDIYAVNSLKHEDSPSPKKRKALAKRKGKGKQLTAKTTKKSKKGKKTEKKKGKLNEAKASKNKSRNALVRNKKAKQKYFKNLAKNWTTSAKIERIREILRGVRENDPTEKTIIFSSFTSFLDLLQVPLQRDDQLGFERYDGSMSAKDRNDAVMKFMFDPEITVLLVSLKAGNAGLNLTAASQVIIVDPWWNPFVEEQAVDRAHRIGQKREVTVHRLIIQETVEDRILSLQDQKRALISAAMDEEAGKALSRLSLGDLVYLFTGQRS